MKTWNRAIATLLLVGTSGCVPWLSDEATLVHYSEASFATLAVTGNSFGPRHAQSYVEVVRAAGPALTISSQSADAISWEEHRAVIKLPLGTDAVSVKLHNADGWTAESASVQQYDLAFFYGFGSSLPAGLVSDANGRIWVNSEFHTALATWDPISSTVQPLASYPVPAVDIFHNCVLGPCVPAKSAIWNDSVKRDTHGRVWFAESGNWLAPVAQHPNHSRILAFDAASTDLAGLYNLPGDRNKVAGLAWDQGRQRIWFGQAGDIAPGRLVSFDPENIAHDDVDFDWTTTATCTIPSGQAVGSCSNAAWHACTVAADCVLADQICPPGASDDSSCYHEYVVPLAQLNSTSLPSQLAVHPDGSVWYADFLGGHLGRLDPTTGVTTQFILAPRPDGQSLIIPWEVHIASNGDVWATVSASSRLVRVPLANQDDDCDTLVDVVGLTDCQPDANGLRSTTCRNPCVEEFAVPGGWRQQPNGTWVGELASYWLDLAADGRVYFDHGYMLPNRQWVFWPPVATLFPSLLRPDEIDGAKSVHATADGTVWLSDFAGSRLMRLTPRS